MLHDLKVALNTRLRPLTHDLALGTELGAAPFAALDFETATASRASACSIGVALVDDGAVTAVRSWLVRPPGNEYAWFNTQIHGIEPQQTADAPSLAQVWPEVEALLAGRTFVAHNAAFDVGVLRASLGASFERTPLRYACTLRLARLAWPGRASYRLGDLGDALRIQFRAHAADDDAIAAAKVALACCGSVRASTLDAACDALGVQAGTA
jgi:DNA polymerase-3 subunit epsilon